MNPIYLEYTVLINGTWHPSAPGPNSIILDTTAPTVTLNSPTGLPFAVPGGAQQTLSTSAQFITGSVSDVVAGEPISVSMDACTPGNACTQVNSIPAVSPPYVWQWPSSIMPAGATYVQITATNAAGNSASTSVPNPATVFSLFSPGSEALTCGPSSQAPALECTTLADQTPPMPGDPPSPMYNVGGETIAFTGYADPSVRADQVVSTANPNGTNLWMLYSYPKFNLNGTTYSGAVEIHLAGSDTTSGPNGGASWSAWCASPPCSAATPIWPSVWNNITSTWSSHEVANFWTYNSNWYAVHLMYFVNPYIGGGLPEAIILTGCLVTTVAQTSPANLGQGWSGNTLGSCAATLPAGNTAITFTNLNTWAGTSCKTWGEPAIMVNGDNGGAAYLAASCFDVHFYGLGYYIFNTTDLTLASPWTLYAGPFTFSELPDKGNYPSATFLTEFDWAQRSDGSLVALVTPAANVPTDTQSTTGMQWGCVAVNFTLAPGSGSPFGTVVATLTDLDAPASGPSEAYGPNGCTYDPISNTGILIVRRLLNTALPMPTQYQVYSLIESGIMP